MTRVNCFNRMTRVGYISSYLKILHMFGVPATLTVFFSLSLSLPLSLSLYLYPLMIFEEDKVSDVAES